MPAMLLSKIKIMSKKSYPFYQVDAFAKQTFGGNPAAVVVLDHWLEDEVLQQIAEENNLSETAFLVALEDGSYFIRWFTPNNEVDLCGHATLASAYVLFNELRVKATTIHLHTKNAGILKVEQTENGFYMDFPVVPVKEISSDAPIPHIAAVEATSLILELESEKAVAQFEPDQEIIRNLHHHGVAITAKTNKNKDYHFVSRFFAPHFDIPEDPVTGSLHCSLVDYWQKKLGRNTFKAVQLSKRKGFLELEIKGDRVFLKGQAHLVIKGKLLV
jgi:predicted PhzF superfamily epimerase YddE/YHI9